MTFVDTSFWVALMRARDAKPTSFALMRSLKIREALAFDGDFNAAGFVELRP